MKILLSKIKIRYKNLSLPIRAALWFTLCQFLQKSIGLITTPIFTRLLSTTEYGRASSFLSWADIFMPLITLSVWRGIMNLFAKDNDKDYVLTNIISLSVVISMVWVIIMILLKNTLIDVMAISECSYWLLIIFCVSQNIFYAWIIRKQYDYEYKPLVVVSLIYTCSSAILGSLAVLLYSRVAESKIIPQVICLVAITVYLMVDSIKKSPKLYDRNIWIFTMGFAIPLIPHYLSEVILQSSDRAMINSMCGSEDVAIYSVAYSVGSLINIISSAVNSAFVSFQYQSIKAMEYRKLAKTSNVVIAFVASCLCLLMLFGREIVLIFGGEKYTESQMILIPICLGVFFNYVFQLFARVQEYFEQKHTIVIASISCALLNIGLNFVFINIYGYKAAAYTTFACYFVFCFLHYLFYRKACMNNIGQEIYDIKGLSVISITLIILAVVIGLISKFYIIKYVLLAVTMLVVVVQRKRILNFIKEMRISK